MAAILVTSFTLVNLSGRKVGREALDVVVAADYAIIDVSWDDYFLKFNLSYVSNY